MATCNNLRLKIVVFLLLLLLKSGKTEERKKTKMNGTTWPQFETLIGMKQMGKVAKWRKLSMGGLCNSIENMKLVSYLGSSHPPLSLLLLLRRMQSNGTRECMIPPVKYTQQLL